MKHNIRCDICGKLFNSPRHNAKTCPDPACKKAAKAILNKKRSPKYVENQPDAVTKV